MLAIGDSWKDIPMLFCYIELVREASLIQNGLYCEEISIRGLLRKSVLNICELTKYDFVPGHVDMSPAERCSISAHSDEVVSMRREWYRSELNKLYYIYFFILELRTRNGL